MASLFKIGQHIKGKVDAYTITKQIHGSIWLAVNESSETVIIKSVRHFRLQNELEVLKRFQARTPALRPLLDEIVEPPDPPALVLQHMDDDVLQASAKKRFSHSEIVQVAKTVLETLKVLHGDGYVHTDIKPDNILVNYGSGEPRLTDVKLADCGSVVPVDSKYAKEGYPIGAPIFRSPEAQLRLPWGTATDIWSLGTTLISLIWGERWHIFKPDIPFDHDHYDLNILMKHHQFFGPFPLSYQELADEETLTILAYAMNGVPQELLKPFHLITEREISKQDKAFVLKIMKLDPRDRPTAQQLLQDEWFDLES